MVIVGAHAVRGRWSLLLEGGVRFGGVDHSDSVIPSVGCTGDS